MESHRTVNTVVIGAGPAGLATSRELARRNIEHIVLEKGNRIGYCWANAYNSLRLHTGKHLSALPGLRFSRATSLFPARDEFLAYLARYAELFRINVELETPVTEVIRNGDWVVRTSKGDWSAKSLVVATGIMSNPTLPELPGANTFRGRLLHSVEYRDPQPYVGQRVLVIGVGNSGGEIASELGDAGVDTTIAVRSGANIVPLTIAGLPSQYLALLLRKLPRRAQEWAVARIRERNDRKRPPVLPRPAHSPLDAIPLIGFHLHDAIVAGKVRVRGAVKELTAPGARFEDGSEEPFDTVIAATGFRAAVQPLRSFVRTDARGFALRTDRVRSADHTDLYFVGHNYDASGGLRNIAKDAPLAADAIKQRAP